VIEGRWEMKSILTIVLVVCMSSMLSADAIHEATYHGLLEEVKLLVDSGANVNSRDQMLHDTPLLIAIKRGFPDIVLFLLQRGAKTYLGQWDDYHKRYILPIDVAVDWLSPYRFHPEQYQSRAVRYSNIVRILKQYHAITNTGSGIEGRPVFK